MNRNEQDRLRAELDRLRRRVHELETAQAPDRGTEQGHRGAEEGHGPEANAAPAGDENYRLIFETAANLITSVDRQGILIDCNQRIEEVLGYRRDEIVGQSMGKIIHPDYHEKAGASLQEILATGFLFNREYKMVRKDGSVIDVEINSSALKDEQGNYDRTICIIDDITEARRAKETLRQSEEMLRSITDAAKEAIIMAEQDGRVSFWNPAAENLFGHDQQEAIGRDLGLLLFPPPLAGRVQEQMAEFAHTGESSVIGKTVELTALRKDGASIQVELSLSTLTLGGRPHSLGILRDISGRRKMEEELTRAKTLDSLGLLAGGIAHDFNNFLTVIAGNLALIDMQNESDAGIATSVDEAEKALNRAKELTQQLLTFAKGGAPVRRPASIADILRESAQFALSGSNVKCEVDVPAELAGAEVDAGQISQVIGNLIINADQAMPDGGIVRVSARDERVEVDGSVPVAPGRYICITVEDQGDGIAAEHLPHVFDPFFTTKPDGNGLGLTSAYSIVRRHDGFLDCASQVGVGTVFRIYLPAASMNVETAGGTKSTPAVGSGRVLVMDDEEMVRAVTGAMLSRLGYEVEYASDGREAIACYRKRHELGESFDAIILDLTVPGGMGGSETMAELAQIDPQAKGIVSSGYSSYPILAGFEEHGFSGALSKPFTITKLGRVVGDVIRGGDSSGGPDSG